MYKFRVHNQDNWSDRMGMYFDTYFKTKREAIEYAKKIGGDVVIERHICGSSWGPAKWDRGE